jgi:hypothetical protein
MKNQIVYLTLPIPLEIFEQLKLTGHNDNLRSNQDGGRFSTPDNVAAEVLKFHFEDFNDGRNWMRKIDIEFEDDSQQIPFQPLSEIPSTLTNI